VREVAAVPPLDAATCEWQKYIYQRDNPCGAHAEWWHHNHGCRQMLEIVRDTLTHEVQSIAFARASGATP
jgi:sarcosine oxidase subunit delta